MNTRFNKKSYFTTILAIITAGMFLITSCDEDKEEEVININVEDITLEDIGQIENYKFEFALEAINDQVQKCKVRTRLIKKGDEIKSITAVTQGKKLTINITSDPFDFDCFESSCFTAHDVTFNLTGIDKGTYDVYVSVNYSEIYEVKYAI